MDVYNVKDNGLLAGVTLPLSSCAPRFFLAPKIPLSLPLRTPATQAIYTCRCEVILTESGRKPFKCDMIHRSNHVWKMRIVAVNSNMSRSWQIVVSIVSQKITYWFKKSLKKIVKSLIVS